MRKLVSLSGVLVLSILSTNAASIEEVTVYGTYDPNTLTGQHAYEYARWVESNRNQGSGSSSGAASAGTIVYSGQIIRNRATCKSENARNLQRCQDLASNTQREENIECSYYTSAGNAALAAAAVVQGQGRLGSYGAAAAASAGVALLAQGSSCQTAASANFNIQNNQCVADYSTFDATVCDSYQQ